MILRYALVVLASSLAGSAPGQTLEFNRDIRPILSNTCFLCHGPDKSGRKGDLRLDLENDVYEDRGDGARIIVPGKPLESEMYKRLVSHDAAKKMPPPKFLKTVSPKEIATIKTWIEQGGKYQKHWSLMLPLRAELPVVKDTAWALNAIDRFVLARLERENIRPSPAADRRTLLRRLSFDLTGLPPTPEQVDAFVKDTRPDAYEKLVERLLDSEHFGERMALYWLDLVRYADTGGYHSDNHRDVALYRDWVINAFNKNMPFDRFTIEQIAGDLVTNPTSATLIASGYNRLLQTTEEGGAQAKEYTAKYFADRVRNVSTVWLGVALGCTECHDHPYDPFTTKEFYQFGAFFADISEAAVGRQAQTPIMTSEQEGRLKQVESALAEVQKSLSSPDLEKAQSAWEEEMRGKGAKGLPKDIEAAFKVDAAKRNPKQKEALTRFFRDQNPATKELHQKLADFQKQKSVIQKAIPQTLVSKATTPRTIRVLPRGNWQDDSGPIVTPGTPASLPPLKASTDPKQRPTRLDLANWMVSRDNPLPARVFMNRLWMLYFGQGLTKVLDDVGSQGGVPTHPELLDWLALEFQGRGWSVKDMIRLMVTSNTYRQSSTASPELRQRDPYNQLLARQGRFRLEAELVRDNALSISGLLVAKVGGPSVKPYQPAGYWRYLNFPTREWHHDKNENLYRRGLYTYWQRSFLQPSLLAFDAPTREECTVERPRSNTPQQALALLNDPTYVEASRALAERMMRAGPDVPTRLTAGFRLAIQRAPSAAEAKILTDLLQSQQKHYAANVKDADALLRIGERPAPKDLPAVELAAWTNVARTILNLHETITRN